jgi:hypothetical protein
MINFIGWRTLIFMQLVKGLKDGPPSIFMGMSKSKEQLIRGGTKGGIPLFSLVKEEMLIMVYKGEMV